MRRRSTAHTASPAHAPGARAARAITYGIGLFFAFLVVLAMGAMSDAAHADGGIEAAPLVASSDQSADPASVEDEPPPPPKAARPPTDEATRANEVKNEVEAPTRDAVTSPKDEPIGPGPVDEDEASVADTLTPRDDQAPVAAPVQDETTLPAPSPVIAGDQPGEEADQRIQPEQTGEAPSTVIDEAALESHAGPAAVEAGPAQADPVTVDAAVVAPPAVNQCNADTFPTGAGFEATCTVTIENTIGADGKTSSTVTTTQCLAAAGVLPPEGCVTETVINDQLVTTVDQCNGILAGGSNLTCSVNVINNVPSGTPTTGVSVNQCIGSGQGGVSPGGPPTDCDPEGSSTTGATVTQCNGSANGGGAPERVRCNVVGAVTAVPVTVNQCNGSTAAGSTVTCDVTFTNSFAADVPDDGPGDVPGEGPAGVPGDGPADAPGGVPDGGSGDGPDAVADVRTAPFASKVSSRSTPVVDTSTVRITSRSGPATLAGSQPSAGIADLAATGAPITALLSAALLLLALGGLLLTGSRGNKA